MSIKSTNQIRFILVLILILSLARTQTVHAQAGGQIIKDRNSSTQADVVADGAGTGINALAVTGGAGGIGIHCATATDCKVAIFTSLGAEIQATTEPCDGVAKTSVPFSIASATTTQLVAASASNKVYICSMDIVVAAANNVALVEDNDASCASPSAGLAGGVTAATGWNFAANGGLTKGSGVGAVFQTAAVNRYVCLMTSGTAQTSGSIQYVLAP
jgi:hypothetical protein